MWRRGLPGQLATTAHEPAVSPRGLQLHVPSQRLLAKSDCSFSLADVAEVVAIKSFGLRISCLRLLA